MIIIDIIKIKLSTHLLIKFKHNSIVTATITSFYSQFLKNFTLFSGIQHLSHLSHNKNNY